MNKITLHKHLDDKEKETLDKHLDDGQKDIFKALLVYSYSKTRVEDILKYEYSITVVSEIKVILARPAEGLAEWTQKRDIILSICRRISLKLG